MPAPRLSGPYREAMLESRRLLAALDERMAQHVLEELESFMRALERIQGERAAARATAAALETFLERLRLIIGQGRLVAFEDVLAAWEAATAEVASNRGAGALLGRIRPAPISLLGMFSRLGGGQHWTTLLERYAIDGAREVRTVFQRGLSEGVNADELARRLRRYVSGSEPFQKAFSEVPTKTGTAWKLDLRELSPAERGAARQMVTNARRIAVSEPHNARAEAEIQAMVRDPFVAGVVWELSPFRGVSFTPPDECDCLAANDFYGLGAGVYPVLAVPAPPHPYDRCSRRPLERSTADATKPKPAPDRRLDPRRAAIPRGSDLTPNRAARIRMQVAASLETGEALLEGAGAAGLLPEFR